MQERKNLHLYISYTNPVQGAIDGMATCDATASPEFRSTVKTWVLLCGHSPQQLFVPRRLPPHSMGPCTPSIMHWDLSVTMMEF
jgi:hypothetical protein